MERIQLHNSRDSEEGAREKMKDVYGKAMVPNPYKKNDTMRLLGRQRAVSAFWRNDVVRREIEQISEARPYSFTITAASDIFMLGYIHGKRAERARRKRGAIS